MQWSKVAQVITPPIRYWGYMVNFPSVFVVSISVLKAVDPCTALIFPEPFYLVFLRYECGFVPYGGDRFCRPVAHVYYLSLVFFGAVEGDFEHATIGSGDTASFNCDVRTVDISCTFIV